MKLNAKQLEYLGTLGLTPGAGAEEREKFVEGLADDQRAFLTDLADKPRGKKTPATANGGPPAAGADGEPGGEPPDPAPAAVVPAAATPSALSPLSPEALRQEAARGERDRIAHVRSVARTLGLGEDWIAGQINGGFTVDEVNGAALRQHGANSQPLDIGAGSAISVGLDRRGAAVGEALVDAMLVRAGAPLLEIDPDTRMPIAGKTRPAHQLAARFRGNSLMMAQAYLQLCGRSIVGMSAPEVARAVFVGCPRIQFQGATVASMTSADFPFLLANAMGISMAQKYVSYPQQWRLFAVEAPASDFRQQSIVQLGGLPILPEVKEDGEYTQVTFGEEREVWTLVKRGHIVALSWEMVLNDQMAAFAQMIAMEGDAAARTDDTLAFAVVTGNPAMGDGGLLFNATAVTTAGGHANLIAHGSGAAPSVATFNAMNAAFGAQPMPKKNLTDASVFANIIPGVVLCPRALEATVDVLIKAQYDPAGTAGTLTPNIWQGRLARASHRLLDAADALHWYACTAPTDQPAMVMGYLEGFRGPQMAQESGFDTDTRKFKVSHFRAAKATDWRLWFSNDGN
jgi:hypothetical protein